MDTADFSNYLKDRYALVQEANKYMQDTQPRKLLKSEKSSDRESGTQCIEHLLWFIKQLAILASPFLIQSTERCHEILGITLNREIFDVSRVALTLHPDVIYVKNV